MELKEYQQSVLKKVDTYLATLAEKRSDAQDFVDFQKSKGKSVPLSDYCRDTWEHLQSLGTDFVPAMVGSDSNRHLAPWITRHDGLGRSISNICLKVPTGGGKTLLAAATVERIQTDYLKQQTGFVLWVVPSDAIYKQTWKQLANREHPYRQMLERASGGRVKLLEKNDSFNAKDAADYLCIMLLMLPSAARQTKDTLRMFRDSGRFTSFFPEVDDSIANELLLQQVKNLDLNDLADVAWDGAPPPGLCSIKHSLGNVLRLLQPIVLIDEGHKAYSDTARDTLCGFNPSFIVELSATPNTNGKHQSNVLVNVPGTDLKDEEMIKMPINVTNIDEKGEWRHTLARSHEKLDVLQQEAVKLQAETGRYIRPIMLVRVERTGKDQRDSGLVHAEDVREYLIGQLGARPEEIRLKTSETDELGDEDLLADTCPVRFIITKDALREGWDCPFAYVLTVLSRTTANTALTQMIGRVLRQPHARLTHHALLDECYVYTFDQEVSAAVSAIKAGLQEEGMADLSAAVRAVGKDGNLLSAQAIKTVNRRKPLDKNIICIPRIVHRQGQGYRALDYERDILGGLDWETFNYSAATDFILTTKERKETTKKLQLASSQEGADLIDLVNEQTEKQTDMPESGMDLPFLVRRLLDVIPNPWQGMRILESALATFRSRGYTDEQLYAGRLDIIQDMRRNLRQKLNIKAESLFRDKLKHGEIALHLHSANDPALNWEIRKTLEIIGEEFLKTKQGSDLERSLFEKLPANDFNSLEKNAAWYLDERESIHWWHRLAVKQGPGLQGWQRQRIYPDFLACMQVTDEGYRLALLETKGKHLEGSEDANYKERLFQLLTEYADKSHVVGELDLGKPIQMTFAMLMEDTWSQDIVKAGVT